MPDFSTIFVLSLLVVAIGAFLQGATGFGFALFSAPLLAALDPGLVPGPVLALTLLFSVGVLAKDWRSIDWSGLFWVLSGRLPATLIAGAIVGFMARETLTVVFALFVLVGVGVSVSGWKVNPSRTSLLVAGGPSGFFGTLTSIGAPPLALVYQGERGPVIRGTLSANIVVGVVVSILALGWGGHFARADLMRTLALVPAGIAGMIVARYATIQLDRVGLRPLLLGVTTLSAIFVLVRTLGLHVG